MPKPYPKEFREDVVNVARNREVGQTIKQIAADFGIAESCLRKSGDEMFHPSLGGFNRDWDQSEASGPKATDDR